MTSAAVGEVPAGVTWTFNRVPFEAVQSMIGFVGDGSPLEYKFVGLGAETAQAVKNALITGVATGRNPRAVAREVNKATDGALLNALTTCRTETMRAYRHAAQQTYKANDDVVKGWVWSCAHQARTCAACWGMDGTFHELTEDLVDHPNGRCVATPVTKSWEEILGKPTKAKATSVKDWDAEEKFRKLSPADQRTVMGTVKHRLWQDGKITLRDLAVREQSAVWGDHYRPVTLQELVDAGKTDWNEILSVRHEEGTRPETRAVRRARLTTFAQHSASVLQDVTKTENRWSGRLKIVDGLSAAGAKDWSCDILIAPSYAADNKNAYPVINHEMLHGLSTGLTPPAFMQNRGWEEGTVEQLQRMLGDIVTDSAGQSYTGSWAYQSEIDRLERIRGFLGVDGERFYLKMIRTPLASRRVLVARAVKMRAQRIGLPANDATVRSVQSAMAELGL